MGPCHKVHDDFIKKNYEQNAPRREKMSFEDEFIRFCQTMLNDVERRIKRAKQRLATSQAEKNSPTQGGNVPVMNEENQEKMKVLEERIETLLEQIEQLGCEGKVEEAQGIMKLVDKLKEEKAVLKRDSMPMHWIQQKAEIGAAQEKQMEVCDVCGAFLIVNDVQQRVDDHLMGKQHMGYGRLKTALDEILERRRIERDKERQKESVDERDRENRRERERTRERNAEKGSSKDRDRNDRGRERDRERDRDRERRKESRERRNGREREKDERDHSKAKEKLKRSRSRSRDTERSRHHKHRSSRQSRSRSKEKKREKRSRSPVRNSK